MPPPVGSHAVMIDGSNIIISYTDSNTAVMVNVVMNSANTNIVSQGDSDFISIFNGILKYELDYNLSTSHVATSANNYATMLSQMTNDPADLLIIAQGGISNKQVIHKFGKNPAVGTSWEDVWGIGGDYTFLQTATTVEAISLDTNDTVAGTGARIITIEGLDANFLEVSENINMNGTTATTATTQTFIRITRAYIIEVGTYGGTNFNDITIRVSSAGATLAFISGEETSGTSGYGSGQTEGTMYCVPADKTAYMTSLSVNVDGSKSADVHFYQRKNADDITTGFSGVRRILYQADAISGGVQHIFSSYLKFEEKTDIWVRAVLGTGSASINAQYDLILVDNIV